MWLKFLIVAIVVAGVAASFWFTRVPRKRKDSSDKEGTR